MTSILLDPLASEDGTARVSATAIAWLNTQRPVEGKFFDISRGGVAAIELDPPDFNTVWNISLEITGEDSLTRIVSFEGDSVSWKSLLDVDPKTLSPIPQGTALAEWDAVYQELLKYRKDPGPKGEKGDKGDKGIPGDKGDPGIQGEKGDRGDQGIQGIQGLKGDKGDPGIQGVKGDQGLQGIQGLQGLKGDPGIQGVKGDQGLQGIQGIQGLKGDQGIQGIQGVKGDVGATGPAASATVGGFSIGTGYVARAGYLTELARTSEARVSLNIGLSKSSGSIVANDVVGTVTNTCFPKATVTFIASLLTSGSPNGTCVVQINTTGAVTVLWVSTAAATALSGSVTYMND